jgi:hypothetical protein
MIAIKKTPLQRDMVEIHSRPEPRVWHDYKYHAEIRFETLESFYYTCGVGNTIPELVKDIIHELKKYEHRFPKLECVYYLPNDESHDIKNNIVKIIKNSFWYENWECKNTAEL